MKFVKRIAGLLFDGVFFSAHLAGQPLPLRTKLRLLTTYLRLTALALWPRRSATGVRHRVLGFRAHAFDRRTLHLLFGVIFIRSEYWFPSSRPDPLVLDCGANVGLATLYFKWLYPDAEVHAFEPDPATFEILTRNVEANRLGGVHANHAALAATDGSVDFWIDPERPGSPRMSLLRERMPGRPIPVPALRLSSYVRERIGEREIDYLKLDVEGAEVDVLRDLAEHDLLGRIRRMGIEFHSRIGQRRAELGPFLRVLEDAGFDYLVDASWMPAYAKENVQNVNIIAVRGRIGPGRRGVAP